ncbi:hypothetical protein ACHAXT_005099 [Thalassiosira profunda]
MPRPAPLATVLPHEPLPRDNGVGGLVHLQGALVPRRREDKRQPPPTNQEGATTEGDGPTAPPNGSLTDGGGRRRCRCADPAYVESTLLSALRSLLPGWHLDGAAICSVEAVRDPTTATAAATVSRARIATSTPAAARTLTARLRREERSPRDLLLPHEAAHRTNNAKSATSGEGLCPLGCGGRYSGRPLQVAQVARRGTPAAAPMSTGDGETPDEGGEGEGGEGEAARWARAAPPKFRRLELTDSGGTSGKNKWTAEELERRRGETRFVCVENVLAGVQKEDVKILGNEGEEEGDGGVEWKEMLAALFRGDGDGLAGYFNGDDSASSEANAQQRGMMEDDLRHSFQEAFRSALRRDGIAADDRRGVELFLHSDTAGGKKGKAKSNKPQSKNGGATATGRRAPYGRLHVGMRSNADASKLIRTWQGRRIVLELEVPRSFGACFPSTAEKVAVTTGKLFLDYADVLLPKGRKQGGVPRNNNPCSNGRPDEKIKGEPSRSECTSATAHVAVPGLRLIEDYVSAAEEQVLLAALTGPHAPRDDGADGRGAGRAACPPLPAMDADRSRVRERTDAEVEARIAGAVAEARGWEALAGVVERTRRLDFARFADVASDGDCGGERRQTYPHLNQLTINEYAPGQGIGSHVDTETAFGDGLLIITLGGGIVMEFRRATENEDSSDNDNTDGRKLLYLPPRSLVLLSGDARYRWEHMIVSRTTDTVDGTVVPRRRRVSLTLRTALAAPAADKMHETAEPLPRYESASFPPMWGQFSDDDHTPSNDTKADADTCASSEDLATPATERQHVHAVYDAIATQWHHTRGKRGVLWPGARRFLDALPKGSVVADVGCGDGKYFAAIWENGSYVIGTDISEPLLRTAATEGDDGGASGAKNNMEGPQYETLTANPAVAVADCLHIPLRSDGCDAALCIAVLHHLSTAGRRVRCLAELRRIVKPGGWVQVQAWALEQEGDSKRKFHGTDVLVPFNAQPRYLQTAERADGECNNNGGSPPTGASKAKGVAQMMAEQYAGAEYDDQKNLVVFQRYCHMYRKGELEGLCAQVPGLEVVESSYEKGNHGVLCVVTS